MKNLPLLIGTIVATLALIVAVVIFFPGGAVDTRQQLEDAQVLLENARHQKGLEGSYINVVEFSDFQCPACAASEQLVQEMLTQYPEEVKLTYRHFPLDNLHPFARLAAQASEVAAEQDQFWPYHDLLFARQEEWSNLKSKDAVRTTLAEYATELELDKDEFLSRMEDSTVVAKVVEDAALAKQLNLGGTPTFFVNGRQTPAQQLLDTVQSFVETDNKLE